MPRYQAEGVDGADNYSPNGLYPPFRIFDKDIQDWLPGQYVSLKEAKAEAKRLNQRKEFTQDDVTVRLHVRMSAVIEAGIYSGPVTKKIMAELIQNLLDAGGRIEDLIDEVSIMELYLDDGTPLVELS